MKAINAYTNYPLHVNAFDRRPLGRYHTSCGGHPCTSTPLKAMNAYTNYPLHVDALIDDLWIATGLVVVVTKQTCVLQQFHASVGYECIYQLSIACKCTDRRSLDRYRTSCGGHQADVCLTAVPRLCRL